MALAILTLITGVVYPLLVTGIAQVLFPHQANGSLIRSAGRPADRLGADRAAVRRPDVFLGPALGHWASALHRVQPGQADRLLGLELWPAQPGAPGGGHGAYHGAQAADPGNTAPIPVDLVTASGSGLDPHISPAAASYQVARVARARGFDEARVRELVAQHTEGRQLGFLGEPRVNVLELNLALDQL